MHIALQHRKHPMNIYKKSQAADADSLEVPRDIKQVHNIAQVVNKACGFNNGKGARNVATDYQQLINGVQGLSNCRT